MDPRWLKDREAAQLQVHHPNRSLLAASEGGGRAKLPGPFPLAPEDSHDGAFHVHAADLHLIGVDDAGPALVREKRDFVVLARRQGCGAGYVGGEDCMVGGVALTAGWPFGGTVNGVWRPTRVLVLSRHDTWTDCSTRRSPRRSPAPVPGIVAFAGAGREPRIPESAQ